MEIVRVAAVQMVSLPHDKPANLAKVSALSAQAASQGVAIVAFPECCLTGYWYLRKLGKPELEALAEPVPDGSSTRSLLALAAKHRMIVGAGLVERADDGRLYNSYVVCLPDGRTFCHRKLHAFVSRHIDCGDAYTVFDSPWGWRIAVLTCYDNNIGENVRISALLGADLLLAPHQTGGCASPNPHLMGRVERVVWDRRHEDPSAIEAEFRGPKGREWLLRWLPARAHDNGLFVVFSNGVGPDDDEVRTGNAMVIDPYGTILRETCAPEDALVVADLDPSLFDGNTGRRWIRSRRPELYGPLAHPTGHEGSTRSILAEEKDFGAT